MAGCKGCQDHSNARPPGLGIIIGPDGNSIERQSFGQGVASTAMMPTSPVNIVADKKPVNFDQAIFYASMATDLLLFPLKHIIKPCSCGKDKQLKAILIRNKEIIDEVLYLL